MAKKKSKKGSFKKQSFEVQRMTQRGKSDFYRIPPERSWRVYRDYPQVYPLADGMVSDNIMSKLKVTSSNLAMSAIYYTHVKDCNPVIFSMTVGPDLVYRMLPILRYLDPKSGYWSNELHDLRGTHPMVQGITNFPNQFKGWVERKEYHSKEWLLIRHREVFKDWIELNPRFGFDSVEEFIDVIDQIGKLRRRESDQPVKLKKRIRKACPTRGEELKDLVQKSLERTKSILLGISTPYSCPIVERIAKATQSAIKFEQDWIASIEEAQKWTPEK